MKVLLGFIGTWNSDFERRFSPTAKRRKDTVPKFVEMLRYAMSIDFSLLARQIDSMMLFKRAPSTGLIVYLPDTVAKWQSYSDFDIFHTM
ncbi:hypothetical protein BOTCAL_0614g00060 [Botryotinia calthae]|uniref:Uncharacterized protein n=1 Tax=Botryotinia calthae TaxID=38488 RepID=A0A4Y8CIP3_9HELO|nr:hypothetical protein BOTCAL_0614g00060 [Botryotinia calthae]